MRRLLKKYLYYLSKKVIKRYHPIVIGITGSVGKTSTKEAVFSALSAKFYVRRTEKSYNQEIGTPLAILGIKPFYDSGVTIWKKFKFIFDIFHGTLLAHGLVSEKYPDVLVLELGADRPGDIEYLSHLAKPSIGIITAIGQVPVHVEFYSGPEAIVKEKSELIKALPPTGVSILNYDDPVVLEIKNLAKGKVITFGFSKNADIWASDISYFLSDNINNAGKEEIGGLSFKVHRGDSFIPMRVNHLLGAHQIYSFMAAIAIASHFGINLVDIATALEYVDLPQSRMYLKKGSRDAYIIDDTYNASPVAMHAALDTLSEFGNSVIALRSGVGRKVAILGDMKELGKYEEEAHRAVGRFVVDRADLVITIGDVAKAIAEEAGKKMKSENVISFENTDQACEKIVDLTKEGDIILVKGSRSMRMEKIVEKLIAPIV